MYTMRIHPGFNSNSNVFPVSFLHYANSEGDSCPQRLLEFTSDPDWSYLETRGLWNMDGVEWELQYHREQVYSISFNVLIFKNSPMHCKCLYHFYFMLSKLEK